MSIFTTTRVAGAWARVSATGQPLGRLHAVRRSNGALEPVALCGVRIPAAQLRARPFPPFDETDFKACSKCVVENWDLA